MTFLTHLAQLEANGLVLLAQLQPEIQYLFRHALVQDAAYASLVKNDRRRLHLAAGEALERLHSAGPDAAAHAPLLARHFAEAGDFARAVHYYTLAGQAAAQVYANAEALHHYGRALELAVAHTLPPDTLCALYLQRGRALELNAQDAAALANYAALQAWAEAGGHRLAQLAALNARATIYVRPSIEQNTALGHTLAQQALALARELADPPGEATALWNLVQHGQAVGQLAEAVAHGDQALALAEAHNLRETRAYLLTDLLRVYFQLGQPDRAVAALQTAQALWRELGVLNMLADNLATTSMMHTISGEYDQALALSGEAETLSRQIGNLWNEAYASYLISMIHFERGDCDRALALAEQTRQLARRAGFAEGENQAEFDLALIYGYLGDLPRALALVRASVARAVVQLPWTQIEALVPLLYVLNAQPAEAQAALEALPLSQDPAELERQFVLTQAFILIAQTEVALAQGRPAQALALAEIILNSLRLTGIHLFLADTLCLQGRALHAAGQLADAHAALAAARAEAEALGSRRSLWPSLAALADLAEAQGDPAAARALRQEAVAVLAYILAHAGSDELRAAFRRRPAVAALLRAAGDPAL